MSAWIITLLTLGQNYEVLLNYDVQDKVLFPREKCGKKRSSDLKG
jgi:hypothetical protein